MQTKGGNVALRAIVGPVVGGRHSVRSRVIVVGVAVAIVIAVALIPTTVVFSDPALVAPPVLVLIPIFLRDGRSASAVHRSASAACIFVPAFF